MWWYVCFCVYCLLLCRTTSRLKRKKKKISKLWCVVQEQSKWHFWYIRNFYSDCFKWQILPCTVRKLIETPLEMLTLAKGEANGSIQETLIPIKLTSSYPYKTSFLLPFIVCLHFNVPWVKMQGLWSCSRNTYFLWPGVQGSNSCYYCISTALACFLLYIWSITLVFTPVAELLADLCEMAPVKAGLLGSTILLDSNQNKMCIFTVLPVEIRSRSNKYSEGHCSQIIWDVK